MKFEISRPMWRMMFPVLGSEGRLAVAETSLRYIRRLVVCIAFLMSFPLTATTVEDDDAVWSSIDCGSEEQVELYLKEFPKGLHVEEAHDCLVEIRKPVSVAEELPSWAILEAQELLALLGYEPGVADGLWGQRTAEAYAEFLQDAGLPDSEYLTVDALLVLRDKKVRLEESAQNDRTVGETFRDCDVCPEMVVIPSGSFVMGSPESEEGRLGGSIESQHQVTISYQFAVGKFEVTVSQYENFVKSTGYTSTADKSKICDNNDAEWIDSDRHSWRNPGFAQGNDDPVVCVSWEDAKEYVNWLSRKTGKQYRLLSESEWEYVARARTTGPFHFGSTISTDQANYFGYSIYGGGRSGIYRKKTVPVGSFPSNAFGLHDVHGNVREWVEDCLHESYVGAPADGSAWVLGEYCYVRMLRGGSWDTHVESLRSANRGWRGITYVLSDSGFRVARTLKP